MVLLNNNNNALPLSTGVSSVAVVGPLANDPADQLGPDVPIGYSIDQGKVVSVLDGIKAAVPGATVTYAQGCDTSCTSTAGFGAAVSAAQASAVTVVVVGEPAADSGEASSRSDISLPGQQLALVQAIAATGKPYVVVLMNGRPLTIGWLADNAPALLESWFPGTEGGDAVADVLFGKVNPGGKLPMSFPRDVGQIPISYNELPTGRPYDPNNKYTSKYLDVPNTPQYPFGYGLSYTTFALSNLHVSSGSIPASGTVTVTADITNTGTTTGDDVAQLYVHESGTSILQPVRRLEGFQRVTLKPGQAQTVTFKLGPANLGFYNNQGQFAVEPGPFDVYVGDSSVGGLHASSPCTDHSPRMPVRGPRPGPRTGLATLGQVAHAVDGEDYGGPEHVQRPHPPPAESGRPGWVCGIGVFPVATHDPEAPPGAAEGLTVPPRWGIRKAALVSYWVGIGDKQDHRCRDGQRGLPGGRNGCNQRDRRHSYCQGPILRCGDVRLPHHGLPAAARCGGAPGGRAARRPAGCLAYRSGRCPAHSRPRRRGRVAEHAGLLAHEQR